MRVVRFARIRRESQQLCSLRLLRCVSEYWKNAYYLKFTHACIESKMAIYSVNIYTVVK